MRDKIIVCDDPRKEKVFICDLDGVLLNVASVFADLWADMLCVKIEEDDFIYWKHDLALGVSPKLLEIFWDRVWEHKVALPYHGAGVFIDRVKYLGYKFVVLTSRGTTKALKALQRDIPELVAKGIDDILTCDQAAGDRKSDFINKYYPEAAFFLDDHTKNVVDVKIRCPEITEVMLLDRPWNKSKDITPYRRVQSYGDVLSILSKELTDLELAEAAARVLVQPTRK